MDKPTFKSLALQGLDPSEYYFFGLWKQNLFSSCFWVSGWNEDIIRQLGLHAEESGILLLSDGYFFVKHSEIANIKRQIFERINQKDSQFFENMVRVADAEYQKALVYSEKLKDKPLTAENFMEFVVVARNVVFLWFLGAEQFSIAAEEKIGIKAVEEGFSAEKLSHIIPIFHTPLNDQHKDILELKKMIGSQTLEAVKANSDLYAKLKAHVEKFSWIEIANYVGESLTVEKLYEQIVNTNTEVDQLVKDIPVISDDLKFHAYCMSQCGYVRQAGAEYYAMLSEKALSFLKGIAQKFNVTYEEFLSQRDVEIFDALRGKLDNNSLKENALRRKTMNFVSVAGRGAEVKFTEEQDDIEILKQMMLPIADRTQKTLSGQIGNRGTYTGVVRIVMNTHDFPKMQVGDVLVSTMTTPDFVILMQKAGAIITDIGGMLCHAAIVSREINKPCIIGTKIATQVLKDGDLVEVDANTGVVRILK